MTIPKIKRLPCVRGAGAKRLRGCFTARRNHPFRAYKKAPLFKKGSLFNENQASILRMSRKSVPFISSMSTGWCSMMQE